MPPLENIKQFIQEEIERKLQGDIDLQTTTVEQVRELIREEVPRILAKSSTTIEGNLELKDSRNIILGTTTGSKFGTATGQKIGFFNTAPIIQPTNGVDLTNNVATGGTNDTIANYTDLSVYANDAAEIRNNLFQLARKLKVVNDALRDLGLNN